MHPSKYHLLAVNSRSLLPIFKLDSLGLWAHFPWQLFYQYHKHLQAKASYLWSLSLSTSSVSIKLRARYPFTTNPHHPQQTLSHNFLFVFTSHPLVSTIKFQELRLKRLTHFIIIHLLLLNSQRLLPLESSFFKTEIFRFDLFDLVRGSWSHRLLWVLIIWEEKFQYDDGVSLLLLLLHPLLQLVG